MVARAFLGGCYDVIDGFQGIKVYKDKVAQVCPLFLLSLSFRIEAAQLS